MPKIVDHEARRREIAAAAARTIARLGVDGATMVEIAGAAGVTTGMVTHYFEDKDQVVLAALRYANGQMNERATRALADGGSLVDLVLAVLPHDRSSRESWLVWRIFGERASRSRALAREYRAGYAVWQQICVERLGQLQAEGRVHSTLDPAEEAAALIAFVDGIGIRASVDPQSWPEAEQRAAVERYLARLGP